MAKYLISTVETYRVDTEKEAQDLIQENKNMEYGELVKYSDIYKEVKSKGEVIDDYHKVTLTKIFDSEKEPLGGGGIDISYYKTGGTY